MFTLNIECSRDIDELHINFVDGTSSIVSREKNEKSLKKNDTSDKKDSPQKKAPREIFQRDDELDLDMEFNITQDIIEKPVIPDALRDVLVSNEIQNLEI